MKHSIALMIALTITLTGCIPNAASQPTAATEVTTSDIPTYEQLEAKLEAMKVQRDNLIKQAEKLATDMIVIQGALMREQQLRSVTE